MEIIEVIFGKLTGNWYLIIAGILGLAVVRKGLRKYVDGLIKELKDVLVWYICATHKGSNGGEKITAKELEQGRKELDDVFREVKALARKKD